MNINIKQIYEWRTIGEQENIKDYINKIRDML